MIRDPAVLQEDRQAWLSVRQSQERLQDGLNFSFASGGVFNSLAAEIADNLFMVFAFGVLHDVLLHLRDEGYFACKGFKLGDLMGASKKALPWQDFPRVDQGCRRRNKLAHKGVMVPRTECREVIDAIEVELHAWKILV